MRPVRLELQGFTTFRAPAEPIDFTDADLFALTGPTGSGKSSIVDAICFALYGSVPRLDKGKVEPVISLGAQEARIRFDFTVEGRPFTVARKVVRTKSGATTAEARLEGGMEVVAGADQVTEAVEDLLGLPFEDFTKSVVLPQGEFAAFLHDKPAKRQDLLRRLLDLGVYERMRRMAQHRKGVLEAEAVLLERQVEELASDDAATVQAAQARAGALAVLRSDAESARPELSRLAGVAEETTRQLAQVSDRIELLTGLRRPDGVELIAERTMAATQAMDEARLAVAAATERFEQAEKALAASGDPVVVAETIRLHGSREELEGRKTKGVEMIAVAESGLSTARQALSQATARRRAATDDARRARTEHAAHAIRAELHAGDTCPVCLQMVVTVPDVGEPEELNETERARHEAEEAERGAAAEHQRLETQLETYRERLGEIEAQLESVMAKLGGRVEVVEAKEAQARIESAKLEVERTRREEQEARAGLDLASGTLDRLRRQESEAWAVYDRARDTVAALGPPVPVRSNLLADWESLLEWSAERHDQLDEERRRTEAEVAEARAASDRMLVSLIDRATDLDVHAAPERFFDDLIVAAMEADNVVNTLEERRRRAGELGESAKQRRREADVAAALARHLSATGFQAWILEEAFLGLVASANHMLEQLSSGAYSLHVDRRDFVVVDHRNADDTRSVKTLSGGETFLVSLALALALAEQLSMVSGAGGARLESIFLDEGFGTLDAETLETVSAVIQELGATGRTVGIITHVTELAEQVPVRFEVRKLPGGSVVTRVSA